MSFKVQFDPKRLADAISKATAVVATSSAPQGKNFLLSVEDKTMSVMAFSSDTFVRLPVECSEVKGSGLFGFTPENLTGVIKNRSEMIFAYDGADCAFSLVKGKYKGSFVTLPLSHDLDSVLSSFQSKLEANKGANKISREIMLRIREGLQLTAIKDVYTSKPLISYLSVEKDKLSVSTLDSNHFAYYESEVSVKKPFKIALPMSHFNVIDKVATDDSHAEFEASNTHLRIQSGEVDMILPATQAEDDAFDLVPNFLSQQKKAHMVAKYDHESLQTVIENLYTLYTVNSKLQFSHAQGDSTIKVAFTTQAGSASDAVKVKVLTDSKFSENVDPRLFKDSLGVLKQVKAVQFSVLKGRALVLRAKTGENSSVVIVTSVSE